MSHYTIHVRRWRFRLEERQFSHEHESLDRQALAFWALPRWKYRLVPQHGFKAFVRVLERRHIHACYHEIQGVPSVGYRFGALQSSLPTVAPGRKKEVEGC
jgi:hypothetical protein